MKRGRGGEREGEEREKRGRGRRGRREGGGGEGEGEGEGEVFPLHLSLPCSMGDGREVVWVREMTISEEKIGTCSSNPR